MVVGLTSGCFDLIHFGHVHYLQRCRALCDRLIVAIDSDKMVREAKGSERPIVPEQDRLRLVNSLGCVDAALIIDELPDLDRAVRMFGIDRVFKHGGFVRQRPSRLFGVDGTGVELVVVPDVEGLASTTEIIRRIKEMP